MTQGPRFLDGPATPPATGPTVVAPPEASVTATVDGAERETPSEHQGPRFLDETAPPVTSASLHAAGSAPLTLPTAARRGWVESDAGSEGPIRHDGAASLPVASPERPAFVVGAIALVLLLVGLAVLEVANFIADQFARATWLGVVSIVALAPAALALVWSILREWRSYTALAQIDGLRRGLAGQDVAVVRRHAERWMLAIGASEEARRVVSNAPDAATVRELLRAGPLADVQQRTAAAGRAAAVQVLAATAVSPWPGLDGVLVMSRGFRLVRQVAQLHGHRPGVAGTVALFRRVAVDASAVAASDVAVSSATEALLNSPMAGGLAGQAAGAAVAARRMLRLAFATAESCRPL